MPEVGQTISHYRIVEKIGQGGMGEVYFADDATLERKVALKFLPEAFTSDLERMARYEREAKLLASLNHPNIAGIHGLEQADGNRFLVLEYVEGETLQARLSKGALPLEDALALCRQIAEGLEAAHEKGVIHRDLKPANVMITAEETVEILDFGLAKAFANETQSIDSSQSPTFTEAMTRPGVILGTAAYMSPEQAKGKSVDKRADVWAFGCILYECLTGKKAFEGETVRETLAAVLTKEPEWEKALVQARRVLKLCLQKDTKKRLRDIGDAYTLFESAPEEAQVIRFLEFPPETWGSGSGGHGKLAVSPDGHRIAFLANGKDGRHLLWIRSLGKLTAQPLAGTEGAVSPFWSPDSRFLGFFADGKLKKIEATCGSPTTLCDAPTSFVSTWNRDGIILLGASSPGVLAKLSASGGVPTAAAVLAPGDIFQVWPSFLPDGRHFLYGVITAQGGGPVYTVLLDSTERKLLLNADSSNVLYTQGHLPFLREGTLMAQPFDARRLELEGDAFPIAEQIQTESSTNAYGVFSVSGNGVLAYQSGTASDSSQLVWFDRKGKQVGILGDPGVYSSPQLSPDGKQASGSLADQRMANIWLYDVASSRKTRFTFDAPGAINAIWSPDGRLILCEARGNSGTGLDLFVLPLSGGRKPFPFLDTPANEGLGQFSPDGRWVAYFSDESGKSDIYVAPFPGPGGKWLVSTGGGAYPRWRPDGAEIFYRAHNELLAATVNGKGPEH